MVELALFAALIAVLVIGGVALRKTIIADVEALLAKAEVGIAARVSRLTNTPPKV